MMQSKPPPSTMLRPFSVIKVRPHQERHAGSALLCHPNSSMCSPASACRAGFR